MTKSSGGQDTKVSRSISCLQSQQRAGARGGGAVFMCTIRLGPKGPDDSTVSQVFRKSVHGKTGKYMFVKHILPNCKGDFLP